MRIRLTLLVTAVVFSVLLSACGTMGSAGDMKGLQTPDTITDAQFAGDWYVVANIPYALERNKVGARVQYNRRPDGRYQDLYIARKGGFDAPEKTIESVTWSLNPPANTQWRTRYLGPLKFDWALLRHDAAKGVLIAGGADRKLAWVFARTREIDDATYAEALDVLASNGFDRSSVLRVPQQASDIGRAGFAPIED